jgi:signal transduction histidine kinase
VVTSLTPTLRKTPHKIEMHCAEGVMLDSYPGALSQVITNLIMNAMVHAFEGERPGAMTIEARAEGGQVKLRFMDDGKGIAAENLPRIFDPFFTTRRGAGGSGLGLNIVFNLVTRKLQGHIACSSNVGQGAVFDIEFPLRIDPEKFKAQAQ